MVIRASFLGGGLCGLLLAWSEHPTWAAPKALPYHDSALIVSLADGKVRLEQNPTLSLSPASLTKLVTGAAVLHHLGRDFRFHTKIQSLGRLQNGILTGDLAIIGDGDPFLVNELLWQAAVDLRHKGLREVRGDIVLDGTLFQDDARDESRKDSAWVSSHAYDAPVSALGVNFNTLALAVTPRSGAKGTARVGLDPYDFPEAVVRGRIDVISGNHKQIEVDRSTEGGREVLHVRGRVGHDTDLVRIYRSVQNHTLIAGATFRAFLNHEGIRVHGKPRATRSRVQGGQDLHVIESFPMGQIISGLNKFSNNYIADTLTKRLGAHLRNQGTFAAGQDVLEAFLRQEVKVEGPIVLRNGSGLDIDNRLSTHQIVDLLTYVERRMNIYPEFLASLPAAGSDGTLERRMQNPVFEQVRAKTGTLTEPIVVSGLAGYVHHASFGLCAFAMIANGIQGRPQPSLATIREAQEKTLLAFLTPTHGKDPQ